MKLRNALFVVHFHLRRWVHRFRLKKAAEVASGASSSPTACRPAWAVRVIGQPDAAHLVPTAHDQMDPSAARSLFSTPIKWTTEDKDAFRSAAEASAGLSCKADDSPEGDDDARQNPRNGDVGRAGESNWMDALPSLRSLGDATRGVLASPLKVVQSATAVWSAVEVSRD
jgi:hypothetical protein